MRHTQQQQLRKRHRHVTALEIRIQLQLYTVIEIGQVSQKLQINDRINLGREVIHVLLSRIFSIHLIAAY